MAAASSCVQQQGPMDRKDDDSESEENLDVEIIDPCLADEGTDEIITQGAILDNILSICPQPPSIEAMEDVKDNDCIFMISPFKYDPARPDQEPLPKNTRNHYVDRWDEDHVRMPCSSSYTNSHKQSRWLRIRESLIDLKTMCDNHTAITENLKETINQCARSHYNMDSLEMLINQVYSDNQRAHFMSTVLSNICSLAMNVDTICTRPPPLLRIGSNRSVTMSQKQAAALLACSFFCLFPFRSDRQQKDKHGKLPNPNFNRLYLSGHPRKMEKLKCILHYFERITEKMPTGVITIRRSVLTDHLVPSWAHLTTDLCGLHLTTGQKIEDIRSVLQVDFANKFIGGGVLGSGCVQEEIRFSICPEMLVSLLVCEVMEPNECVFLIGCERYSSYKGYSDSFQFDGNFDDTTAKDQWGRKWCHLVAMDAIFFRDPSTQYNAKAVDRELLKAYTSFRPLGRGRDYEFGIATGNWGCGAFRGDKYVKAIIQLMAASEAGRPLIYAAYRDSNLVHSFGVVYEYLNDQKANVGHLYRYLQQHFTHTHQGTLFDYILNTPIPEQKH